MCLGCAPERNRSVTNFFVVCCGRIAVHTSLLVVYPVLTSLGEPNFWLRVCKTLGWESTRNPCPLEVFHGFPRKTKPLNHGFPHPMAVIRQFSWAYPLSLGWKTSYWIGDLNKTQQRLSYGISYGISWIWYYQVIPFFCCHKDFQVISILLDCPILGAALLISWQAFVELCADSRWRGWKIPELNGWL
jgi:hypothetical protein